MLLYVYFHSVAEHWPYCFTILKVFFFYYYVNVCMYVRHLALRIKCDVSF